MIKLKLSALLICSFICFKSVSQLTANPEEIKKLIEIKKELTNSNKLKEFYLIQLHSGDLKEAEEIKKEFDKQFDITSTIKYESPNYKVWVGNFRTRLEADRAMQNISESFKNAFIIKPGRN